jgi:hypothetical protein
MQLLLEVVVLAALQAEDKAAQTELTLFFLA